MEDEKTLLEGIELKLGSAGYEVIMAEDGESGERLIKEEKPDLILLDVSLPLKGGFQILEDLARDGNKTPVIIVSNSGQPVELKRALELGVKDYLIKTDFVPSDVLEKIESVLGSFSAEGVVGLAALKSVLVVDDDILLRRIIGERLEKEGFEVRSSADAAGAFDLIKQKKPNLILLDLVLPGIGGLEMLKQLKGSSENKNIPVVVLSNLGQKEEMDSAVSSGAIDYLLKTNFTPTEIVQRVKKILEENNKLSS